MLRLPAVAGRFYPSDPNELSSLVNQHAQPDSQHPPIPVAACLVPHAGYVYSGHVAGAVFARVALPKKVIILGVRHYPRGEAAAILSSGAWRTPLGDAPIDAALAEELCRECPLLREDSVAHSAEHSLEVQIPFLQVLAPGFSFVPVALGTVRFELLVDVGEAIARVLGRSKEDVLLLTSSDLNHYEDDATTRVKDHKAIDRLLALDPRGLYDTCRIEEISMCGLGPAVAMLTALNAMGVKSSELVKYATSADVSGDLDQVVGYAGMIFPEWLQEGNRLSGHAEESLSVLNAVAQCGLPPEACGAGAGAGAETCPELEAPPEEWGPPLHVLPELPRTPPE